MRSALLATVACACLGGAGAAQASPGPVLPLGHTGRWMTDAQERVVVLHGFNEGYKLAPFYPAASGFGDADAAFLAANGFNAVRVEVFLEAVEPQPGVFDDGYLSQIAQTVATLARHGIVSLLDFHQDLYTQEFGGEGFPAWATLDGGLPNPALGFPGNYLGNPAEDHAWDALWANDHDAQGVGLEDAYAAAWQYVAAYFASDPGVLGYELLNEPWPGTAWEPCANTEGCPASDATLTAFYRLVDAAIRTVDRRTLVFYEPNVIFNNGANTDLGSVDDTRAGFAFHDYCLSQGETGSYAGCAPFDDLVFSNADAYAAAHGLAELMTEFGATHDAPTLTAEADLADQHMVGWLEWAFSGVGDITTSGPGDTEALVDNPAQPPTGANVNTGELDILARPYPQVIAGTPRTWSFAGGSFSLQYATSRADGGGAFSAYSETDVSAPAVEYARGYAIRLSGAALASPPGAVTARILACPGASAVGVTIAPSASPAAGAAASTESCPPPATRSVQEALGRLYVSVSRTRARVGRAAVFAVRVRRRVDGRYVTQPGALVKIAGARVRTGREGIARLRVRFHAPGRWHVRVYLPGFRGVRVPLRTVSRR